MPPEAYEPSALLLGASLLSLASVVFWFWMAFDCYRRYGGLHGWHYFFFLFPPSVVFYFATHAGMIFRGIGSGRGLFGMGLKSRIRKSERSLHITDTIAARAELAELYFEAGRYAECEEQYHKVLSFDPKNLEAFYYVGQCRLQQNDAIGALELLRQVVERDRKLRFGLAWLRYTDCLIALGKVDEALEERRKLHRAYPRPLMEYSYAQLLAEAGQKDKARAVLEEMLETSDGAPREDRPYLSKGRTLLRTL
ncbi:MAG TPA: tetratricopeptide repeat protein [Planctomycetota bacterium]|jgi:tetratricopeptide (TPR) repeat protein